MIRKCKICDKVFSAKLSHIKMGYAKYCSRDCSNVGMRKGELVRCTICKKETYKSISRLKVSKSGKFFCNKSCQTTWRNKYFSGNKHKLWKGGFSIYRDVLLRNNSVPACTLCSIKDIKVLAVHHIDENHRNNEFKNLAWLCHNCHYLVHNFKVEKDKFELLRSN